MRFARDLGVFGSFPLRKILSTGSPSLALRRHHSVSCPSSLLFSTSLADDEPSKKAPRTSYLTLQRIRVARPIFSPLVSRGVKEALPHFLDVPLTGFGYPLSGFRPHSPWGSLSAPNAPRFQPFRALLLSRGPEDSFRRSVSALALVIQNLAALNRRFSGFIPREKPPSLPPNGLD